MAPDLRRMTLLVAAAVLAGCATPRYQTVYRYEPPSDATGRACLESCEKKLAGCQQHCTADYQACLKRLEPLVEERYNEHLKRYADELNSYRLELRHYELSLSLSWGYDPFWYGPWPYYHPWPAFYNFPPEPPEKPSREAAFNQLRKEKCEADCGCLPLYDACFLTCGGKKIPEVKCIANCPEVK